MKHRLFSRFSARIATAAVVGCAILTGLCLGLSARAAAVGEYNVRDFGATGDGAREGSGGGVVDGAAARRRGEGRAREMLLFVVVVVVVVLLLMVMIMITMTMTM